MRAQLAVSSLIVFGLILIGLGFTRLPYVLSYDETVAVQTSRMRTVEELEVVVKTSTLERPAPVQTTVATTFYITETTQSTATGRRTLAEFVNRSLNGGTALAAGPFDVEGTSSLEVVWRSNSAVNIFLAFDDYGNVSSWMLLGRGVTGSAVMPFGRDSTVYVIVMAGPSPANFSLTAAKTGLETITTTRTLTSTAVKTTTYTTTSYITSETTYTSTQTTQRPEFYVVTYVAAVTETRYPDLSFMTLMGSFIVFVGILLMVLLLKTLAKPPQ
ncbi:MAG: hypothetical protein NZ956_02250 [Candidatus Caldarchaeum sp.]|nr:hypothetical protein [Candidatus Caldarchaeum sp.]